MFVYRLSPFLQTESLFTGYIQPHYPINVPYIFAIIFGKKSNNIFIHTKEPYILESSSDAFEISSWSFIESWSLETTTLVVSSPELYLYMEIQRVYFNRDCAQNKRDATKSSWKN